MNDDPFAQLRDFLAIQRRAGSEIGALLLDHGAPFAAGRATLPAKEVFAKSRQCYWNAFRYWKRRPELTYCEGYADIPLDTKGFRFPVMHGWCCTIDGTIHDPSIANTDTVHYLGLRFTAAFTLATWRTLRHRHHSIGILPNLWLLDITDAELLAGIAPATVPAPARTAPGESGSAAAAATSGSVPEPG